MRYITSCDSDDLIASTVQGPPVLVTRRSGPLSFALVSRMLTVVMQLTLLHRAVSRALLVEVWIHGGARYAFVSSRAYHRR